jgi:predicted transcriptional regulator
MTTDRRVLLSLRPRFADALLEGSKTVEIRRRPTRIASGSVALVYASSPRRALLGAVVVGAVDIATPQQLWRRHGPATALDRDEYDTYLAGRPIASALIISAATRFRERVELEDLRERQRSFVVPQSYRFVEDGELRALLNGQAAAVAALATHHHASSASGRPRTRQ